MTHHTEIPLLPPLREQARANHHWVERIDYDGRACGLEVYQWQPHARKWCLPNCFAQGGSSDKDLKGYRYVAICPTPPYPEEVTVVQKLLKQFGKNLKPDMKEDFETFKRVIGEQIFVHPQKK